jgi:hypothetical protein
MGSAAAGGHDAVHDDVRRPEVVGQRPQVSRDPPQRPASAVPAGSQGRDVQDLVLAGRPEQAVVAARPLLGVIFEVHDQDAVAQVGQLARPGHGQDALARPARAEQDGRPGWVEPVQQHVGGRGDADPVERPGTQSCDQVGGPVTDRRLPAVDRHDPDGGHAARTSDHAARQTTHTINVLPSLVLIRSPARYGSARR